MRDYMALGPTPCDEPRECLGVYYDAAKARAAVRVYCAQLVRQFEECDRVMFGIRCESHDFGTYYEAAVYFDNADAIATGQVLKVAAELPVQFDPEAREMLAAALASMMTEAVVAVKMTKRG